MTEGTFKQLIEKALLNELSQEELLLFHRSMDQNPDWKSAYNKEKAAHLTLEYAVQDDLREQFKSWDSNPKKSGLKKRSGFLLSFLLIAFAATIFLTQRVSDQDLLSKYILEEESYALRNEKYPALPPVIDEYNKAILHFQNNELTEARNIFASLEFEKSSIGHKSQWMQLMILLKEKGSEDSSFIESLQIINRAPAHSLYKQATNLEKDLSSFWHF